MTPSNVDSYFKESMLGVAWILEKISGFVKNGVRPTQSRLCHARTGKWVSENLDKEDYEIFLWGTAGDVFHSAVVDPLGKLEMSYYSGAPHHELASDGRLLLDNGESLELLYRITVGEFNSRYLGVTENTTSVDLNIGLAVADKAHKNRAVYNEPDLKITAGLKRYHHSKQK